MILLEKFQKIVLMKFFYQTKTIQDRKKRLNTKLFTYKSSTNFYLYNF